jgi:NAD(P)-dependent dehydrogenase (short-subunit alcohol dehydrogenase family)
LPRRRDESVTCDGLYIEEIVNEFALDTPSADVPATRRDRPASKSLLPCRRATLISFSMPVVRRFHVVANADPADVLDVRQDAPGGILGVDVTDAVRVALVAGATRGAGRAIAVELARADFYVYATGRSSRTIGPSEIGRPETIEETGDLIAAAGGTGTALVVDHEDPASVAELVAGIEREGGRLDLLVNDIFGGDRYMQWDKPLWEHDWAGGLRMLQMGVHTHLITCRAAIPFMLRTAEAQGSRGLVVEMTDGTSEANAAFRRNVGFYYDLVKANVERIVKGLDAELENSPVKVIGVTPGWLRSERMLENFGVSEANWRDAVKERPGFGISESPTYVARGVAALARAVDADRWAGTIVSARQLADAYDVTDTDGSRPDCWGHLAAYGWDHDDGRGIDEFR